MAPILTVVLGGLAATYLFLQFLLKLTQDAKEPPVILTGLPFISPVIAMVKGKTDFHVQLRFASFFVYVFVLCSGL